MLQTAEPVAFLPSTDLERSERFFHDVLGLAVVSRSPFATVVRVGDGTLRITKVDALTPQPFTVFGWLVTDLRGLIHELLERELQMLRYDGMGPDDDGIWATPSGDLIAWFPDPDGNVLSLTELSKA